MLVFVAAGVMSCSASRGQCQLLSDLSPLTCVFSFSSDLVLRPTWVGMLGCWVAMVTLSRIMSIYSEDVDDHGGFPVGQVTH